MRRKKRREKCARKNACKKKNECVRQRKIRSKQENEFSRIVGMFTLY